jgi:hypothetical protein
LGAAAAQAGAAEDERMRKLALALMLCLSLPACQLAGGAAAPGDGAPAPVTPPAGDITVTPLDAPSAAGPAATAQAPDAVPAPVPLAAPVPLRAQAAPPAAPRAQTAAAPGTAPDAAEAEAPPAAVPEAAKPPQQIACERKGGRYVSAGADGGAKACVRPTRDAGKRCRREGDCEGRCLARSQTCAPIDPLFGCNDILQADGRRVTLCID